MLCHLRIIFAVCSMFIPFIYSNDYTDPDLAYLPKKVIISVNEEPVIVDMRELRDGSFRVYAFSAINESGSYRLAGNVNNAITIATNNVQLNLAGGTVTGGIIVNSNLKNITINNGTVIPGSALNAITINSGCTSIKILDVSIQDLGTAGGILMTQAVNSTVKNCEMIQNTTGLTLNQCSNIMVQDCSATRNTFFGFSLLTSNTCAILGCKAISTGANNTFITLTSAIGFASNNGVGNVFDRCIANSTQALTTTDSNSVVAGFALRGTERGTRITNCTAANTATSVSGATIPYGILLEASVSAALTPTGNPPVPNDRLATVVPPSWSPDGKYFAVISQFTAVGFRVYLFNRKTTTFMQVAAPNPAPTVLPQALAWSPSGQFIAAGMTTADANRIKIYRFDPVDNALRLFAVPNIAPAAAINSLSWHPNEKFLVASIGTSIILYSFNAIAKRLTQLTVLAVATSNTTLSPDGQYLANGGTPTRVFKIDYAKNTITVVATGASVGNFWFLWNPNGLYLSGNSGPGASFSTFSFDRTTNSLTLINTTQVAVGGTVAGGAWSPDGRYLATGTNTSPVVKVFSFNQQANTFTQAGSGGGVVISVRALLWHPSGEFLTSEDASLNTQLFYCFSVLTFPSQNIITNNTVYCNSGNSTNTQSGIGISGSSMSNYIAQNTVYSDPINPPVASINYAFVLNVYNTLFQDVPTLMQNVALPTCAPIPVRPDRAQQLEILLSKLTDIATKVDLIRLK